MTLRETTDLIAWSLEWARGTSYTYPVSFHPTLSGLVTVVQYRDKSTSITLDEPVSRPELMGTLNTVAWGLLAATGEITQEELREVLGAAAV